MPVGQIVGIKGLAIQLEPSCFPRWWVWTLKRRQSHRRGRRTLSIICLALSRPHAVLLLTDVPVLSRWAKLLMMVQAMISLTVIVVLAARASNML